MAKRKASQEDDDERDSADEQVEKKKVKKTKKQEREEAAAVATASGVAKNGQPCNKTIPEVVEFAPKHSKSVRIASWNVCGLANSMKKGSKTYIEAEDADILILTETRVNNMPLDLALNARYPYSFWSISDKKTYAGTAVLSKIKPMNTTMVLPGHPDPSAIKGRLINLEFEGCYIIGTYVTNAGQNLKTLDAKKLWNEHFTTYIRDLEKQKPVIWIGDLNVAPAAIDLANPKPNWNKTPGYTEAETVAFADILNPPDNEDGKHGKFVDVWRSRHPDTQHYTYWSFRFNCRTNGTGWRIDGAVVSERIEEKVYMCEIRDTIYGASDHVPITIEVDSSLFGSEISQES